MKKLFQIGGVFEMAAEYEPDVLRIEYDFHGLKLGFISAKPIETAYSKFVTACKQAAQNGAIIDLNFDEEFDESTFAKSSMLDCIESEDECYITYDATYHELADYSKYLIEWKASHVE